MSDGVKTLTLQAAWQEAIRLIGHQAALRLEADLSGAGRDFLVGVRNSSGAFRALGRGRDWGEAIADAERSLRLKEE
jgi:hypothetical protein